MPAAAGPAECRRRRRSGRSSSGSTPASPAPDEPGQFAADVTGTLIGFVHDANTIIESVAPIGLGAYGSVRGHAMLPPDGHADRTHRRGDAGSLMLARCALLILAVALWLLAPGRCPGRHATATLATLSVALACCSHRCSGTGRHHDGAGGASCAGRPGPAPGRAGMLRLFPAAARPDALAAVRSACCGLMALAVHAAVRAGSRRHRRMPAPLAAALSCALAAAGALPAVGGAAGRTGHAALAGRPATPWSASAR